MVACAPPACFHADAAFENVFGVGFFFPEWLETMTMLCENSGLGQNNDSNEICTNLIDVKITTLQQESNQNYIAIPTAEPVIQSGLSQWRQWS